VVEWLVFGVTLVEKCYGSAMVGMVASASYDLENSR
jgi:hypothetical protein